MNFSKSDFLKYVRYEKETGDFFWVGHHSRSFQKSLFGTKVGSTNKRGYFCFQLLGKKIKIHRLVWFFEHNEWPEEIDHINGDKSDNRITNLRSSNRRYNMQNRKTHREGRLVGSYFHRKANAWVSQVTINGKHCYLGLHDSEYEAHLAYKNKLATIGGAK